MTASHNNNGKVAQLTPEEWKQLALLNVSQLMNYLQNVPGNTESGASGMTEEQMQAIGGHINRFASFIRAWSLARVEVAPPGVELPEDVSEASGGSGGGEAPKKKGGWPAGKPRKAKDAEANQ